MQYSTLIRKKDKGYQYIITYKVGNKWKTKSKQGFKKRQDAQAAMDEMLKELKKIVKNNVDPALLGMTFKTFTTKYLDHLELHRTTNTILAFKTVINRFSAIDNKPMEKITILDLQAIVDNITREGLNPNTIQDYIRKLNTIFKAAMDEYEIISSLPTKKLKYNKSKQDTDKRALTLEEEHYLLESFKNNRRHKKYYLIILLALKCGLRLGEILGLTWKDIDEVNNTLNINKQWKQIEETEYGYGPLKSKNSYRKVPISEKTLSELKKDKKVVNINNRLFNFGNTDSVSICINRLIKLKGVDITVHELRHTYATKLIANGVDFKTAAQFLGHSVDQTMKTYSHVNDDMIKKATGIVESIF
ncbi:site-specific integrase [Clostridium sporogenes]|uniref:site-specific integrase n=1 Tax=Clostridium sporogenes TaxID=1509 RepID=UPI002237E0A3|nr:site-specific integrase [Clostridium sporogenes]MCW6094713.1 site-specific integrase [Clostridium sporogenes]